MRKLCILGVDPGTTTGYAMLDIEGNLLRLKSARDLSVEKLLQEISDAGKVIVVGVDVKHSPRYVERICRILGAKLVSPGEDVKEGYKDRITENFRIKDDHQRDALASALLAYNEVKEMFRKVDQRLKERGKEHVSDEVKLLALKGFSVEDALLKIEKKDIIPKKKKRIKSQQKTSRMSEENEFLQQELKVMKEKYESLRKKFLDSKDKIHEIVSIKLNKNIEIQKRNINSSIMQVNNMQKEITALKNDIEKLRSGIMQDKKFLRRFPTLEMHHFNEGIDQGECIVIENTDKLDKKCLDYLEKQEACILSRQNIPNPVKQHSITWISLDKLPHEEVQDLVIVKASDLKKERENANLLDNIIEEYKKKRIMH